MNFNYSINFKNTGKIIKSIRRTKRLSQAQLAEICNVSESHIKNIESGSTRPGLDVLVRICNALGIPLEHVMTNNLSGTTLTLSQFKILDGLNEQQQISCIEMLEEFKHKKRGNDI